MVKKFIILLIVIIMIFTTTTFATTQIEEFIDYYKYDDVYHETVTEAWEYNVSEDGTLTSGVPRPDLSGTVLERHNFNKNVCKDCGYQLIDKTITLNKNIYLEGELLTWASRTNTAIWKKNSKRAVDGYLLSYDRCELVAVTINDEEYELTDWFYLYANDYNDNSTINCNFYYEYTDWETEYNVSVKHCFWDENYEQIYEVDKSFVATPGTQIQALSYSTASRFYFRTSTLPGGIWYLGDFSYEGGQHNSVLGVTNNECWYGVEDILIHDNVYITFNYYFIKDVITPTTAPTTEAPTEDPTEAPTENPTEAPSKSPTEAPSEDPTEAPVEEPTEAPIVTPTVAPTESPTENPTEKPTEVPTVVPTNEPTEEPIEIPPTEEPIDEPSPTPTIEPIEETYSLTINYWYADGSIAADSYIRTGLALDTPYNVKSPKITGYTPDIVEVIGNIQRDTVYDIYYSINDYTLTVKYKYISGNTAAPTVKKNLVYNEEYKIYSPKIENYEYDKAVVQGTMPAKDTSHTVYYTPFDIIIIDEYGTALGIEAININIGDAIE